MQFCSQCGSVLNLLEFPDEELCFSCRKAEDRSAVIPSSPQKCGKTEYSDLQEAVLHIEKNQLVLHSPEGWVLWSGPAEKEIKLGHIHKQANRILEIRKRRADRKNNMDNK